MMWTTWTKVAVAVAEGRRGSRSSWAEAVAGVDSPPRRVVNLGRLFCAWQGSRRAAVPWRLQSPGVGEAAGVVGSGMGLVARWRPTGQCC